MKSRLLLVEDESNLAFLLSERLHREGYEVDTAGDGDQGLLTHEEMIGNATPNAHPDTHTIHPRAIVALSGKLPDYCFFLARRSHNI